MVTDIFKKPLNLHRWQVKAGRYCLGCNNLNEIQFAKSWLIFDNNFEPCEIEVFEAINKHGVTELRRTSEYEIANYEFKEQKSVNENEKATDIATEDIQTIEQPAENDMAKLLTEKIKNKKKE